jgi:hypothetical protein
MKHCPGPAILTECHWQQQTQVQKYSKNYVSRIIQFLSIVSIPIPICRGLVIGVGIGIEIAIGIDFMFLNTVQLELLSRSSQLSNTIPFDRNR